MRSLLLFAISEKPMRLSKHRSDDDEAAVDGEDLGR